jgi:hypothetical protein
MNEQETKDTHASAPDSSTDDALPAAAKSIPGTEDAQSGASDAQSKANPPTPTPQRSRELPVDAASTQFEQNIAATRYFAESIGPLADAEDRKNLAAWFGPILEMLKLKRQSSPDSSQRLVLTTADGIPLEGSAQETHIKGVLENATKEDLLSFAKYTLSFKAANVSGGALLRRSALMALISHIDVLFAELLRHFYKKNLKALPASRRTIGLDELRELGTIAAAEEQMIARQVDKVLRMSFTKQLHFFQVSLKINLDALKPHLDRINEVFQRRHLLVHSGGQVNRLYRGRVARSLVAEYHAEPGSVLHVDLLYLRNAIDLIQLLGTILLQQCWRHWSRQDVSAADRALIGCSFEAVREGRYALMQGLGEYARHLDFQEDESRRLVLLNFAQSYKWAGDQRKTDEIIAQDDWSACGPKFKVALNALQDQHDEFFTTLPRAVKSDEISLEALKGWPIFQAIRKTPRFDEAIAELFPESIPKKTRRRSRTRSTASGKPTTGGPPSVDGHSLPDDSDRPA